MICKITHSEYGLSGINHVAAETQGCLTGSAPLSAAKPNLCTP